jgi:hypothetical protein
LNDKYDVFQDVVGRKKMKRVIIGLLGFLLIGCPEYEAQTLWVQGNVIPEDNCEVNPQAGGAVLTLQEGVLDLALNRDGYLMYLALNNKMSTSSEVTGLGTGNGYLNNNDVSVQGAQIFYDTAGLSVSLPQGFFQPAPIGMPAGESGVLTLNVIPSAVLELLRQEPFLVGEKPMRDPFIRECFETVLGEAAVWNNVPLGGREVFITVRLIFEGVLSDGIVVHSNEFRMPIKVCTGCLIQPQMSACTAELLLDEEDDSIPELLLNSVCKANSCVVGQDKCWDARKCFLENAFVEEAVVDKLLTCASNPAFPSPTAGLKDPNSCLGALPLSTGGGGAETASRLTALLSRYTYERYDAYCYLEDEAPTWPAQD